MRVGWTKNALGDVVLPIESIDPTKAPTTSFRYVDVSSVSNETFEIVESTELAGKDAPSRARRKIRAGDVIFATIRPTLKRVAIVPPELDGEVCSTGYFVFRTKPFLDSRYLFYWLLTDKFFASMERLQTGASYPAVNDTQVRQQEIVYPSLPEQRRIVAILDEAFAGLATATANAEKNLKNARELFDSYLNSILNLKRAGWKETAVGEIATVRTGKVDANHQTDDGAYPFFTCAVDRFRSPTYSFDGQSIILPGNGANVGRVFFHAGKFEAYQRTYVVNEIVDTIDPMFLFNVFRSAWARYIANKQFGSATNYIVVGDLKNFPVIAPPLNEQRRLATRIEEFRQESERLEANYQQRVLSIADLKQSLLQKAFSGGLTAPPSQTIKEAAE